MARASFSPLCVLAAAQAVVTGKSTTLKTAFSGATALYLGAGEGGAAALRGTISKLPRGQRSTMEAQEARAAQALASLLAPYVSRGLDEPQMLERLRDLSSRVLINMAIFEHSVGKALAPPTSNPLVITSPIAPPSSPPFSSGGPLGSPPLPVPSMDFVPAPTTLLTGWPSSPSPDLMVVSTPEELALVAAVSDLVKSLSHIHGESLKRRKGRTGATETMTSRLAGYGLSATSADGTGNLCAIDAIRIQLQRRGVGLPGTNEEVRAAAGLHEGRMIDLIAQGQLIANAIRTAVGRGLEVNVIVWTGEELVRYDRVVTAAGANPVRATLSWITPESTFGPWTTPKCWTRTRSTRPSGRRLAMSMSTSSARPLWRTSVRTAA